MSNDVPSSKKRRLESELSHASGITLLSNITQTTELSSDLEDSNSDSSSFHQNNPIHDSFMSVAPGVQTQVNNPRTRSAKKPVRQRQVSWSIDDDETFVKEMPAPTRPVAPYDNNFNGTNNSRRRTRRATESSLDNQTLLHFQQESRANVQCDTCSRPMRSYTTSQINGNEDAIQRQRMIDNLVRNHDAQQMQQRRSQSVTSLRALGTHQQSGGNMYESLQSQGSTSVINKCPVDTVVTINTSKDYLHPTIETNVKGNMKNDGFAKMNDISAHSCDESSSYADVIQYKKNSIGSHHQTFCLNNCGNSFYRKGFYGLLVLNVILVLLNSFGLPFVYFAIKKEGKEEVNTGGRAGAQKSEICVKCDMLILRARGELENAGVTLTKDNKCCFKSSEQLLPAILKSLAVSENSPPSEKIAKIPVIQLRADKKKNYNNTSETKVVWEERPEINTMKANITNNQLVLIPKSGYYYVYSRVHYEKSKEENNDNEFTIGHSVMKITESGGIGNGSPVDEVVQRCFPSKLPGDVRHANNIGSVQHLLQGDYLYINLDHKKYFSHENTLFGLFLIAT